jgi:signal transduction histidine kinase
MTGDDEHLSALWLATLQRVTDRVAHEIRNSLNGVAVNVEVVRSRAARGGKGSTIAPFATAAAGQVEILSGRVDALVALIRPTGAPVDLGALLGRLVALLRGGAGKGEIELDLPLNSGAVVSGAGGDAIRLALTAALLAALDRGGRVVCRLATDGAPSVYISCDVGGPLNLASDITDSLTRAGILLTASAVGIVLTFPSSLRD